MILTSPIWDRGGLSRDPRLAFVIMPFQPEWATAVYTGTVRPAVEGAGLAARRGDELYGRNVLDDIWSALYASRLVIADLSNPNVNVYYELGIAHTLGKQTILLTQDFQAVPFDLRQQRLIVYSSDPAGMATLGSELQRHIAAVLAEPVDELYHLRSILGGFVVTDATLAITVHADEPSTADLVDTMDVVGARENVVLINKVLEHRGEVVDLTCNHRFVRSTSYPDIVRIAALFDPPYVQLGTREKVEFGFTVRGGFTGQHQRYEYDIAVETERLHLRLSMPQQYSGQVHLAQYVKPTDHNLRLLSRTTDGARALYEATLTRPDVGGVYLLKWT